jgi:hypothetical protein
MENNPGEKTMQIISTKTIIYTLIFLCLIFVITVFVLNYTSVNNTQYDSQPSTDQVNSQSPTDQTNSQSSTTTMNESPIQSDMGNKDCKTMNYYDSDKNDPKNNISNVWPNTKSVKIVDTIQKPNIDHTSTFQSNKSYFTQPDKNETYLYGSKLILPTSVGYNFYCGKVNEEGILERSGDLGDNNNKFENERGLDRIIVNIIPKESGKPICPNDNELGITRSAKRSYNGNTYSNQAYIRPLNTSDCNYWDRNSNSNIFLDNNMALDMNRDKCTIL